MIIHLAEYDVETGRLLRMVAEDYCGPWALCKNDASKKAAKDASAAQKETMAISKQQLAKSNALIDTIVARYKADLEGRGIPPEEVALQISQFRNNLSRAYSSGAANLKSTLASRGGYQAGGFGGIDVNRLAGFQSGEAQALSGGILGIRQANIERNLAQKNFAGTLYGTLAGTQANTATGFGGISQGFGSNQVQAARQADAPSPLWGVLEKAIGAGASIATGGLSGAAGAATGAASGGGGGWM